MHFLNRCLFLVYQELVVLDKQEVCRRLDDVAGLKYFLGESAEVAIPFNLEHPVAVLEWYRYLEYLSRLLEPLLNHFEVGLAVVPA